MNERVLTFVSASESNDAFSIHVKSNRQHFAPRGFKDSIGNVEYGDGKLRIGLRAGGRPSNVIVDLSAQP